MDSELDVVARHARTAPIDLEGIFADLGITYQIKMISSGESGWIERDGDRYRVVVNAGEPVVRQRFTAAHELAHYLLHRDLMNDGGRMNRHTDRLYGAAAANISLPFSENHEVQANRLAAQIVMPADLVREKYGSGVDAQTLAREFLVSKPAMEIRLKTLGLGD